MKKIISLTLSVLILVGLLATAAFSVSAASTTVYFYNSKGWSAVNAYVYDPNKTELLGAWPGSAAEKDDADGTWYKIDVPAATPFNIIFSNEDSSSQSQGAYIQDPSVCYVNVLADHVFSSKNETVQDLGDAMANIDEDAEITVYFYNSKGYQNVYAYVYGCTNEFSLGAWPGTALRRDGDSYWYSVTVKSQAPFHIMFNDGTGNDDNKTDVMIEDETKVYTTITNDMKYATKEEAESVIGEPLPIPEATTAAPITLPTDIAEEAETGEGNVLIIKGEDSAQSTGGISEKTVVVIVVFAALAIVAASLAVVIVMKKKKNS
ncbi:MAG: starch-binding protein [Ruminococcus sp.]